MFRRIVKAVKHPSIFIKLMLSKSSYLLSDRQSIKLNYYLKMGKKLNLKNPITFNEKLQWLKLNDRNPLYTTFVDKYEVKEYVGERIGKEFIIPSLGVWNNLDEIDFDSLPEQFVLKTTHDSGTIVICKNKNDFDRQAAIALLTQRLKRNYYKYGREWPYKNVTPRIIAEKYMTDESNTQLRDYKFFCFDGEVKAMFIASDRGNKTTKFDFFDTNMQSLPIKQHYPNSDYKLTKPLNFEKMKELASLLSKGFPHVRVDFYNINGKIFFGEMTFYHFSGMEKFEPDEWDMIFGEWIDLSKAYCYKKTMNMEIVQANK